MPSILLTSNAESTMTLAAKATNSCSVLARPYSPDQAKTALHAAWQPECRHTPMILPPSFINGFRPVVREKSAPPKNVTSCPPRRASLPPALQTFREGVAALKNGDIAKADILLQCSYHSDPENIETCLALSRINMLLHKEKEEFQWIAKAGILCLKRGETAQANIFFSRLPRGKKGQNALLAEAGQNLQTGETRTAAFTFLQAHKLDPSQALHSLIARTCMFTPAPEEHMRGLIGALNRAGHNATAVKLSGQLLPPAKIEEKNTDSFLSRFPVLHDILSVAVYTFKTWKHAA